MKNQSPKYRKSYDDLRKSEREKLARIQTLDDIKSAELIDIWTDDHEVCIGVKINRISFGIWWTNYEVVAAFEYTNESLRAKKIILQVLKDRISYSEK